ncbi:MAG: DUF4153 domain-containing protein, partial [Telluria sp.]
MHAAAADTPDLPPAPGIAATRISIGLVQGLVLYLLYRAGTDLRWPATEPLLFLPLLMAAVMAPVIAISGLGHMTRRQLLLWVGTAGLIIAALACYDAWRMEGAWRPPIAQPRAPAPAPSPQLCLLLAAGFFIAHALVLAGTGE